MRLNKEFRLNHVGDEALIIKAGGREADLSKVFSVNEPAAWLFEQLGGIEFDEELMVTLLTGEFDVETDIAREDIKGLVHEWKLYNIIL